MPLPSTPPLLAGIDIGGTNVRCALARGDAPGQTLVRRTTRTPTTGGTAPVLEAVTADLAGCLGETGHTLEDVAALGCVVPGITDAAQGLVINVANIPGWLDIPLGHLLEQRFGRPAAIENDVNAAALGEFAQGAGRGCHSMVYLTVSTGVAAGIVVAGTLLRGFHHAAGELGYFVPAPEHLGKDWSPSGCLELTAAGIGLARAWAARRGGPATPDRAREVFDAAAAGDPDAQALLDRAGNYLGQAAVALSAVLDPERIVLGGSIAQHQPVITARIRQIVAETLLFPPTIVPAALGGDAPLLGALALAAQRAAGPS